MRFPNAVKHDKAVEAWMCVHADELGEIARHWFNVMRDCGDDVRELLHDGHPTACVDDAAFAYANAFTATSTSVFFAAPNSMTRMVCSKAPASSCATSSSGLVGRWTMNRCGR